MSEITTVARPYAKAIFESACEKHSLKEWSDTLKRLAFIASSKEMQPVLTSPLVPKEELASIFIDLGGESINEDSKNLINLLAEGKRLNLLPAIAKLFEDCVADLEKRIEVKVVSAYSIDPPRLQRLKQALENYLNRQVAIRFVVDNTLIGGAIIYAGDEVIDGSLRSKLNRLFERLSC
ncbi:MAG: F0F1 ATP synthase subunit delta [Gammaproteobacteria bacterium]|nr:F0F1 ATP synthase subunit delta [Gammaproteobacteria bacterium]